MKTSLPLLYLDFKSRYGSADALSSAMPERRAANLGPDASTTPFRQLCAVPNIAVRAATP